MTGYSLKRQVQRVICQVFWSFRHHIALASIDPFKLDRGRWIEALPEFRFKVF